MAAGLDKPYIIAEIASAHEGRSDLALELANHAVNAGADAVKFQIFNRERLLSSHNPFFHEFGEIELSAKQVDIPLCVLIYPRRYLAGSYPCLDWVSRARLVIETAKKREHIEFHHLVNHGRRAYGALINYMMAKRDMSEKDIVDALIRDGVPGRLVWTTTEETESRDISHSEVHPHLYTMQKPHWSNV